MERIKTLLSKLTCRQFTWTMVGTAILSFGIYNIHRRAAITKGGRDWTGSSAGSLAENPGFDLFSTAGFSLLCAGISVSGMEIRLDGGNIQHKSGRILPPVGEFPTDASGFVSLPAGCLYSGRYVRGNRRRNYCPAGRFQRRR